MTGQFFVVIPARYDSSRLPVKALADIHGKPLIQYVYEQAQQSAAHQIIIATDDRRIADAVSSFCPKICMTKKTHRSGSDRVYEVCQQMNWHDDDIVVNLQGDEPLIPPSLIDQVASNLHQHIGVSTLCQVIEEHAEYTAHNVVKVVRDTRNCALYFSRAPIPWTGNQPFTIYRHIGIYAYRVGFLQRFVHWPVSDLERAESLEQLRILSQGESIYVDAARAFAPAGVDTAEDLERVRNVLKTTRDAGAD